MIEILLCVCPDYELKDTDYVVMFFSFFCFLFALMYYSSDIMVFYYFL